MLLFFIGKHLCVRRLDKEDHFQEREFTLMVIASSAFCINPFADPWLCAPAFVDGKEASN